MLRFIGSRAAASPSICCMRLSKRSGVMRSCTSACLWRCVDRWLPTACSTWALSFLHENAGACAHALLADRSISIKISALTSWSATADSLHHFRRWRAGSAGPTAERRLRRHPARRMGRRARRRAVGPQPDASAAADVDGDGRRGNRRCSAGSQGSSAAAACPGAGRGRKRGSGRGGYSRRQGQAGGVPTPGAGCDAGGATPGAERRSRSRSGRAAGHAAPGAGARLPPNSIVVNLATVFLKRKRRKVLRRWTSSWACCAWSRCRSHDGRECRTLGKWYRGSADPRTVACQATYLTVALAQSRVARASTTSVGNRFIRLPSILRLMAASLAACRLAH